MSKPVIGVTTGRVQDPRPGPATPTTRMGCRIEYPACVLRSGGAPILLPPVEDLEVLAALVDRLDGLLLTGGGDILPSLYGEQDPTKSSYGDASRDRMECEVVRLAVAKGLPILGICRGIQVLNVAMGGTLIQDIKSEVDGALQHPSADHSIEIEDGSLLSNILDLTRASVNSRHHQAVRDVADGLKVAARSEDGIVEGMESSEGLPILAVQCHPEDLAEKRHVLQKLFEWLVSESQKWSDSHR